MKQVQILANFVVGDNLDEELLLEVVEAAIKDALFYDDSEYMRVNYGDLVHSVEVNVLGRWNK